MTTFVTPPGPEPLQKASAWRLFTDEDLIDAGLGTPEMIARDEARSAEIEAWRRSRPRSFWVRQRVLRAIAAAAGAFATWAERQHDELHVAPDPGCALCRSRDDR